MQLPEDSRFLDVFEGLLLEAASLLFASPDIFLCKKQGVMLDHIMFMEFNKTRQVVYSHCIIVVE
jgi:hypothetical protein